jgi:Ser/Thr protein kinase RdoA (MazF antagonist)
MLGLSELVISTETQPEIVKLLVGRDSNDSMKANFEIGPRAEYTGPSVAAVAKHFGLGTGVEWKDLGGTYNLNLFVHTSRGEYVIRIHRPWVSPERLTCLHHIKQGLIASELPLPVPLGWVSESQLGLTSNRLIEVETFIPSEGVTDAWARYLEAFSMLGRLHQALREHAKTIHFVSPVVHNYGQPTHLLKWLGQTIGEVKQQGLTNGVREALSICEETEDLLRLMQSWWEQRSHHLPIQLVHGDYGGENILWSQESIVALLDFDMVDVHERVYELAYSLYWMFLRLEGENPLTEWSWHKLKAMFEAYETGGGDDLSVEERQALPLEMGRVPLYWIATAGFELDPVQAIRDRARSVEVSRWLVTHVDEVTAYY